MLDNETKEILLKVKCVSESH